MSVVITDLSEETSVTLYPDELPEEVLKRENRLESVTGYVYSEVIKLRKAWNLKAFCEDSAHTTLLTLSAEDYLTATINSAEHTVIMTGLKFTPLKTWGTTVYEVSLRLEERGY
ncbi:MAG: hypothetical protein GXX80_10925 [Thermotogaceae bacterium]|nr:hypothetical protein [Thermotogaceae bacterium]